MIVDARVICPQNPWRVWGLRALTGKDPSVAHWISGRAGFEAGYQQARAQVRAWLRRRPEGMVWVGCTGGKHRSVYVAERLGRDLGVEVRHRDLD